MVLGFYWSSKIADPKGKLSGNGNQYRYILVKSKNDFPKTYFKKLLKEAYIYSLAKVKDKKRSLKGATIIKSISAVKRCPGLNQVKKSPEKKLKFSGDNKIKI